jgi:putative ABC transport system permease protein
MRDAVTRGIRAFGRNRRRSALTVGLLALASSIALASAAARADSTQRAERLRQDTATLIQINPAGVAAGGGTGDGLPQALTADLQAVPAVVGVEPVLRRQFRDPDRGVATGVLNGVDPNAPMRLSSAGSYTGSPPLTAGRPLQPADERSAVAVVGEALAERFGLQVGSTLSIEPTAFRGDGVTAGLQAQVVGVFRTGIVYADTQVFVPLELAQSALATPEQVSQFWVQAQDAGSVEEVEQQISQRLAGDVDVLAQRPGALAAQRAGDAIQASATGAAVAAGAIAAALVMITMVLVVRERRREIATYRALGAPRWLVAVQLGAEALTFAVAGVFAGAAITVSARLLLAGGLTESAPATALPAGPLLAATLALALVSGVAGSLYPAWRVLRLAPAEAMSSDR